MKKINSIIIIIYLIVMVYFALFNWALFTAPLNVSLGFNSFSLPVVANIFILSIIFMGLLWFATLIAKYQNEKKLAVKDKELNQLKAAQYENSVSQIQENTNVLNELSAKIDMLTEEIIGKKESTEVAKPSNID